MYIIEAEINMKPEFSVVVPVYNEEESLDELIAAIESSFKKIKKTYEIVFVDDGSTDSTFDILKKYSQRNDNIRIYSFRKNQGKSPALTVGFHKAAGRYILTMDADLQDDPQNIERLLRKMNEGYDMVSGWRKSRKDSLFKVISSRTFNRIVVPKLFGLKLNDLNCGLKLYKREVIEDLTIYGGMHRFIPVLAHSNGFKVTEVPIVHHERKYGYSKYKPTKILTDIPDLITMYFLVKYNNRPLHFFTKIGLIPLLIGGLIMLYLTYEKILGNSIGGRPLLIFGALFLIAGIQTIFTGLIADLIVNMHQDKHAEFPLKYQS